MWKTLISLILYQDLLNYFPNNYSNPLNIYNVSSSLGSCNMNFIV
jgi:hypothetical protein